MASMSLNVGYLEGTTKSVNAPYRTTICVLDTSENRGTSKWGGDSCASDSQRVEWKDQSKCPTKNAPPGTLVYGVRADGTNSPYTCEYIGKINGIEYIKLNGFTHTIVVWYPDLTITSPENIVYTDNLIDLGISSNSDLSDCKFSLNSEGIDYTMTKLDPTHFYYEDLSLEDGSYTAKFSCNSVGGITVNEEGPFIILKSGPQPPSDTGGSGGGSGGGGGSSSGSSSGGTFVSNASTTASGINGETEESFVSGDNLEAGKTSANAEKTTSKTGDSSVKSTGSKKS